MKVLTEIPKGAIILEQAIYMSGQIRLVIDYEGKTYIGTGYPDHSKGVTLDDSYNFPVNMIFEELKEGLI